MKQSPHIVRVCAGCGRPWWTAPCRYCQGLQPATMSAESAGGVRRRYDQQQGDKRRFNPEETNRLLFGG